MNDRKQYFILAAIATGLMPVLMLVYANMSIKYKGLPGCEMIESKEVCGSRDSEIAFPYYLLRRSGKQALCAIGTISGKWGKWLVRSMWC